jgi:hypothetical protein
MNSKYNEMYIKFTRGEISEAQWRAFCKEEFRKIWASQKSNKPEVKPEVKAN